MATAECTTLPHLLALVRSGYPLAKLPTLCGVYAIEQQATGIKYIGATRNIARRWSSHRSHLKHGKHHCQALQAAWDAAGGSAAFRFTILELCTPAVLYEREMYHQHIYAELFNDHITGTRLNGERVLWPADISQDVEQVPAGRLHAAMAWAQEWKTTHPDRWRGGK